MNLNDIVTIVRVTVVIFLAWPIVVGYEITKWAEYGKNGLNYDNRSFVELFGVLFMIFGEVAWVVFIFLGVVNQINCSGGC